MALWSAGSEKKEEFFLNSSTTHFSKPCLISIGNRRLEQMVQEYTLAVIPRWVLKCAEQALNLIRADRE